MFAPQSALDIGVMPPKPLVALHFGLSTHIPDEPKIIAVDIGGGDDYSRLTPYGLELSGWTILARKFVSSSEKADLPAMTGIISRCCTLTSANRTKRIQTDAHLLMLEPPVTQYGMFDIRTDAVICEVESRCYDYAQAVLKNWREKY